MPRLSDVPIVTDTTPPESVQLMDIGSVQEKPNLVDGDTHENISPGPNGVADRFTLSPRRRKELGVKDDETYTWALNSDIDVWNFTGEHIENTIDDNPGARVLTDPNRGNKPVKIHDLVCIVKPKSLVDLADAEASAKKAADAERIKNQDLQDDFNKIMADPAKRKLVLKQNADMMQQFMQSGDTHGQSMKEAMRGRTTESIRREQHNLRTNWRPFEVGEDSGKKSFAIGAGLKDGKVVR